MTAILIICICIVMILFVWLVSKQRTEPSPRNSASKEVQFENAKFLPEVVKMINEGHTVTIRVKGFSMRPFLENNGDKALLKQVKNPKVGDPVMAEITPGHFVLHRIIAMNDERVVLRGDGNLTTETCRPQDIVAEVEGFYRKGRTTLDRIDGRKWRIYSFIWEHLYPIRRYLLAFYRRIWLRFFKPI